MGWIRSLPGPISFLIWLLIVFIVIIILALIISALGGFDWAFSVGHFHWDFGVTKK
jgi:hypothetical protein